MRPGPRPRPLFCTGKEAQYVPITRPRECNDNKTPCTDNETLVYKKTNKEAYKV